jgi:hypothetical protein
MNTLKLNVGFKRRKWKKIKDFINDLMNSINVWRVITLHTSMEKFTTKRETRLPLGIQKIMYAIPVCPSCKSFDYYILKENNND